MQHEFIFHLQPWRPCSSDREGGEKNHKNALILFFLICKLRDYMIKIMTELYGKHASCRKAKINNCDSDTDSTKLSQIKLWDAVLLSKICLDVYQKGPSTDNTKCICCDKAMRTYFLLHPRILSAAAWNTSKIILRIWWCRMSNIAVIGQEAATFLSTWTEWLQATGWTAPTSRRGNKLLSLCHVVQQLMSHVP